MNKELFDKGLEIRKSVLGKEFVENSIKNADDFNMPMQELATEYCWATSGDVPVSTSARAASSTWG